MKQRAILLATRSAGKLRELRPLFAARKIQIMDLLEAGIEPRPEEADVESFATFDENAVAKARYFFERSGGTPTIADDSGLEAVALGGAPGVHSKRWSGHAHLEGRALDNANNEALLAELQDMTDRRARYVCVAAYVDERCELTRRGQTTGTIGHESRGQHGFGYDPYFVSSELGLTFAELAPEEKERVSHRGRAFRALLRALEARPRG
ncbi:MAG: RdgB/HAM1 family non-canonical purine NTP pyrophosphatase [Gemmatimonadaceae bacterium]